MVEKENLNDNSFVLNIARIQCSQIKLSCVNTYMIPVASRFIMHKYIVRVL